MAADLLLLLFALSFPTSVSQTILCEGTNSTSTAAFLSNLNLHLDSFPSPNATFSTQSYGSGPGKVYSLALCLGDVGLPECSTCLSLAAQYITQSCPNNTETSVWLDNCQLCYSGTLVFTTVDTRGMIEWNTANTTRVDEFSEMKTELLKKLVSVAAHDSVRYADVRAGAVHEGSVGRELQLVVDQDYC